MKRSSLMLYCIIAGSLCIGGCASKDKPTGAKLMHPAPLPPAYPKPQVEAPNPELRRQAIEQIKASAKSQDPLGRCHAVEASKNLPPDLMSPIVLTGLDDPSEIVRFASLVVVGEMRMAPAFPTAAKLINDHSTTVQVAATFALHRLGDTTYSHNFEKFASDPDRQVRANTAMLLGLLGEPSASKVLKFQLNDNDPVVRLQAAESLWRLHDNQALDTLVIATISRYPDDRMVAALALAAPHDPRVAEHIRGMLTSSYPEVCLVAARAMGMLGFDEGYGVATQGAKSSDARQRQLAAMAFGAIGRMDSQQMLGKLLRDNDEDVRIAASAAILQLR